ncbi:SH2 domain-containing protein 4A-like isoform X2 [Zophobas morio]
MLQQILRDMYVDPDILAELDEQQKQTLFCKMREEQVRRWKVWNDKLGDEPHMNRPSSKKKKVSFLKGEDGEPWVWVMGEHKDDKSIEEILKEEAIDKARKMAEKEAEELRKQVEAELYIELTPKIEEIEATPKLQIDDDMDIYCSVDELREKINNKPKTFNYSVNQYQNKNRYNVIDTRDVLQEISLNTQKVAQRVALWERLTEERTCQILQKMQRRQQEVAKEAEEAERKQEQLWMEQERKAKQAEQQIREIARRAREEHRLTSNFEIDTSYSTVNNTGVPPGKNAVIEWYRNTERPKWTGLDSSNNVESWFHGLITRPEAEKLLLDRPYGSFLVRLSERIWGYAISYRAQEKCKHYLVSATATNKYQFLGNNQIEHNSLRDLIDYHRHHPLTGGEKLIDACPRSPDSTLNELFDQ